MVAKTLVAVASFVGLAVADSYVYRPAAILPPNQLINPTGMTRIVPSIQPLVYATATTPTFYRYPAVTYVTAQQQPPQQPAPKKEPCDYLDDEYEINVSIDRTKRSVGFTGYLPFQQATVREIPSTVVSKQYHSQDEFGNYKYGYTNPNFEKHESGNANSEVKGHYSYIDKSGNARKLYYVADSHGFHITGDDVSGTQTYLRHRRSTSSKPVHLTVHEAVPTRPKDVPSTTEDAPATVVSKQYHTQDDFGNYKYGYADSHFEKHESGNADNEVRGHYRYIDGNGLNRVIEYVADRHGFHVKVDGIPDKASFSM